MFPVALLVRVPISPPPQVVGSPQIAIPAKPVFPETTFPITEFPGAFRMYTPLLLLFRSAEPEALVPM